MSVQLSVYDHVLRQRFGAKLQAARQMIGYTQLDLAVALDYGYPGTVSQVERGKTSLPEYDLIAWATALRRPLPEFAKAYMYYNRPDIYHCMYGENPYDLEMLPRSDKAIQGYAKRREIDGGKESQG